MTANRRQSERVLICEPHPEMRAFLVRLVEHLGCTPVIWPSPSATKASADVLIVDVAGEDEFEIARRAIGEHPGLPLVLIALGPLPAEAVALDPVAVLEKPFSLSDFTTAIGAASTARAAHS